MDRLWNCLNDPNVQSVVSEFFDLIGSGRAVIHNDAGRTDVTVVVGNLFDILNQIAEEHDLTAAFDDTVAEELRNLSEKVEAARTFCLESALDQTIVALFMMRQKLQQLGEQAQDESVVIATIDKPIALLIPEFSLLRLWEENQERCARVWDALTRILRCMDRWCPDGGAPVVTAPTTE